MSITAYLIVFGSGLLAGMLILAIAQKISSGESLDFFSGFSKLFSIISRSVRKVPENQSDDEERVAEPQRGVDPREQNLYDSAQTIRNILLILATSIQRTGKAASDSSIALGDVKSAINTMDIPTDLGKAHSLLLKEIDLVISSNTTLKGELAKSQAVLNEQQRQIEALRTAVRIDGLTQLANRAYFDEKLGELIALRKRYGDPFSLMMIDLDNFKGVNDSYGHPAGDRILKGVAMKIKASLRGSDFLARFGGDEYALILIKTGAADAAEVAWKLCEEIRGSRFLLDKTAVSMTLSIGLAEAYENDSEETLLKRADDALYRAKSNGRNGVAVADKS
ncbi:MAG: GGDEF domain-containing protein [Desulfuromonadaceae bacterium]|nr:GGDEF domain-containing protein [Desulfuromonadaceae bacterium]MDD2855557.1 GGDEF domain-containing protein [Desulfuromonadaceae bacterium]